jgi:creatinine amidohydrolase
VADAVADRINGVVVAPALSYGSSGEHAGFTGTLSIGQDALEVVLIELGRSADHFASVVFVNGHGGNLDPVRRAERQLRREGRKVRSWFPVIPGGDAHAGRTETSLLLAIAPEAVHPELAEVGNTTALAQLLGDLELIGVIGVSPNGVLGDPDGASVEEGVALLDRLAADLAAQLGR